MSLNTFEERRNARIDRLLAAAERKEREAEALHGSAHDMASIIPFGQPILVGHHSERRDRNYRARIENRYRKSFQLSGEAKDLQRRAEAAQNNHAIYNDDPDADDKLAARIAQLEQQQATWKAINKAHANFLKNPASLDTCDLSEATKNIIRNYKPTYSWEPHPIAPYQFTNLGANIRRLKERLQTIERHANDETTKTETNGVKIVDNVEDNRLQLFFPGKPSDAIRSELKSHGFRWSPTNGCWQAYRNNNATYWANQIVSKIQL